ncbi:MAG: VacJ family lipoprotein [Desulfoferrobacter sp.]
MSAIPRVSTISLTVLLVTCVLPIWKADFTLNGKIAFENTAHAQLPIEIYKTYPETMEEKVSDPLEPYNRIIFKFNDRLYFWAVKPVGKAYARVVPEAARTGLRNAFYNFLTPARFANNLFQLRFKQAAAVLARFVLNSTFGFAGFYDFVGKQCTANLGPYDEDLGQTLEHYGMGPVFYIIWPFLGPSTLRDSIGVAGDGFMDPMFYLPISWSSAMGIKTIQYMNEVSLRLGEYSDFLRVSLDPYVAMRKGYIQYRQAQIKN